MIMIVKTPGSQKGSLAAAEEGAQGRGRGRGEKQSLLILSRLSRIDTTPA